MYDASTGPLGRRQLPARDPQRHERVPRIGALQLPAREAERERLLLREGRHRQAEGAAERRRVHGRRADPPEPVFFFGGYQRTQAETGFVPTASSITVLPQALQLIQGARTKENVLAAFAALNPSDSAVDPEGAVLRPHRHAPASRTSR